MNGWMETSAVVLLALTDNGFEGAIHVWIAPSTLQKLLLLGAGWSSQSTDQVSLLVFFKGEGDQLQEIVAISFKVSDIVNTSVTFKL